MLSVEEYRERVIAMARPLPVENCPVGDGIGRILAEDLAARVAVPPFDNSAMDGFAVRSEDLADGDARLRVVGDIPAGAASAPTVGPGEAARIMTGAPMPPGANAVVPVEDTDQPQGDTPLPEWVTCGAVVLGKHVRMAGENVQVGDAVLRRGDRLTAAAAAAAVSAGYREVPLARRPKIAVLATGSELVDPGQPLGFGQIPDSNSVLISALATQFGGEVIGTWTVPDDDRSFRDALNAAAEADVIVTSGGVSVGAFEVVRQVVEGEIEFVKVSMQPGKPQACGRIRTAGGRDHALLALPGNPVSVFVSSWVYLRPLITAFQGAGAPWKSRTLPAGEGWTTPPGRRQFMPVVIQDGAVFRAHSGGSGSHMIASLHLAEALAVVPGEIDAVAAGDPLTVYPLIG